MTELEKRLTGALFWQVHAPSDESEENANDVLKLAGRVMSSKELEIVGGGCPPPGVTG